MEPLSARKARVTASATCSSMRRFGIAPEIAGLDRNRRGPRDSITGASPRASRPARRRGSPTSRGGAGPRAGPLCASSARARPRSASRERSWNSSNRTAATPSSAGSSRIMRAKTPSVTTSIRVLRPILEPRRTRRPDRLADRLAERLRHAVRRRPRREPARLQHDDLAAVDPGLVEQHERHARGLAGAGRRDEHRVRPRAKARRQVGEHGIDGKGGVESAHAALMAQAAAREQAVHHTGKP